MDTPRLGRRALVAVGVLGLAACGRDGRGDTEEGRSVEGADVEQPTGAERIAYGEHPSQWLDLSRPSGGSRGLVVVIHGGFWKAQYGAEYGAPLAADLADRGWTTANVEYRRVGAGGGWPATCDDVAAAIDRASDEVGPGPVVALGHSAGGHLAAWSAARTRFDRWAGGTELTHVVSQAGVLDLSAAFRDDLGTSAVRAFMGADPSDPSYDLADPRRHVPLDVPLWAVHARDDDTVPFAQSVDYVESATRAGAEATLVEVGGGHFGVIEPASEAWARIVEVLEGIDGG